MDDLLFVYGTLKRGFDRRAAKYLRSNAQYLGPGSVCGRLYDLGSYPALVLSEISSEKVFGEVFQLTNTDAVFAILDRYEGAEYLRKLAKVYGEDKIFNCWLFEFQGDTTPFTLIESGVYPNPT